MGPENQALFESAAPGDRVKTARMVAPYGLRFSDLPHASIPLNTAKNQAGSHRQGDPVYLPQRLFFYLLLPMKIWASCEDF